MTIRIGQLSDTHFVEPGEPPEGGFSYDIVEAFGAVRDHMHAGPELDFVVITGDVADHGRPAQYRVALDAFEQLPGPVHVTPGNHDQDAAFQVGMGATKVSTPRVVHRDNWCFVFVDSNLGLMVDDGNGHRVDPDYSQRLWGNGLLGSAQREWLRQLCDHTAADHVFVWLHHPPGQGNGAVPASADYVDEWRSLLADLPIIRGFGGGHTHMPLTAELDGVPVHVCPALKNNFDLDRGTLDPQAVFTSHQRQILLHGHCHEKAIAGTASALRVLQALPGAVVSEIPSGCCGMAGSFGYEREHYDISMRIGELILFPAVRAAAEDAVVVASGTSCRHQIHDGTGAAAVHLAELLADLCRAAP